MVEKKILSDCWTFPIWKKSKEASTLSDSNFISFWKSFSDISFLYSIISLASTSHKIPHSYKLHTVPSYTLTQCFTHFLYATAALPQISLTHTQQYLYMILPLSTHSRFCPLSSSHVFLVFLSLHSTHTHFTHIWHSSYFNNSLYSSE